MTTKEMIEINELIGIVRTIEKEIKVVRECLRINTSNEKEGERWKAIKKFNAYLDHPIFCKYMFLEEINNIKRIAQNHMQVFVTDSMFPEEVISTLPSTP